MPCIRAKSGCSRSRVPFPYSHPNCRPPVDDNTNAHHAHAHAHAHPHNDPMSDKATPYQMRQTGHVLDAEGAKRDNAVTKGLWSREIWQKIKEVPSSMNIDGFLDYFVPSDESVPLPECPPVGRSFANIGEGGLENAMYRPLVSTWVSVANRSTTNTIRR